MNAPRPPGLRAIVLSIVAAAAIGAGAWFFGLALVPAILLGAAILAVTVTWSALPRHSPLGWAHQPAERLPGARRDIETLSWSMRTRGGVSDRSLARVREAARRRLLLLHGLDLFDDSDRAAIERIVSPTVVRLLLSGSRTSLDLTTFTRILGALEALERPTERHS